MDKMKRRYDIDWLRTLGVLLVIPFHSLLIFNMKPYRIVYIKDTVNVRFFNMLDSIIAKFHMPLLFMLAGMSVYFALQSKTVNQFVNERIRKLLVPAIFGCIFLNPLMTYIYYVSKNKQSTFINHFIGFFTKNPGECTGLDGAFTPAHLWFIIFLFVFSIIGLPTFLYIKKYTTGHILSTLATFFEKPLTLILTIIPVSILSTINLLGNKNPFVYFSIFVIGYLIATSDKYQKAINRDKWLYFLLSIILLIIQFNTPSNFQSWSVNWILNVFIENFIRILLVFSIIGIGNCYMNKNSPVLDYLSKASFPVYIIHMLINTIVGFFVIQFQIGVGLKYILIVVITFILSFVFYEIIRKSKILRFIFAIKPDIRNSKVTSSASPI